VYGDDEKYLLLVAEEYLRSCNRRRWMTPSSKRCSAAAAVGVWIDRPLPKMRRVLFAAAVAAVAGFATLPPGAKDDAPTFNRVASFYVCTQLDPTCNTDTETVAEIVAVTEDGYTAVYTDGPQKVCAD
jgi:hypothetical protein